MNSSEQTQLDVLEELAYDPAVDSAGIAVTATEEGVVTLEGSVPTYMQARAAARAVQRVRGVSAVVNDLEVNPPPSFALDDTALARAAVRALGASATVPIGEVTVTVSRGWVTLAGSVLWDHQRRAAHDAVRDLSGVRGISNTIRVEPPAGSDNVRHRVEQALRRNSQLHMQQISVDAVGNAVILRGTVASLAERAAAERLAHSAPGVALVDNRIEVRVPPLAESGAELGRLW
jgi:osmotically-inducible protein OsmY